MKKLICITLALILSCSTLAGCSGGGKTGSYESSLTSNASAKEKFINLEGGIRAYNFSPDDFKANFNLIVAKSDENRIGEWDTKYVDGETYLNFNYGNGTAISVFADSDKNLVKGIAWRANLKKVTDAEQWGRLVSSTILMLDTTLSKDRGVQLLTDLDLTDLDAWTAGHQKSSEVNDIFYTANLDEDNTLSILIMPMPTDDVLAESSSEAPVSSNASESSELASSNPPVSASEILNVDWEKCIADTKASITDPAYFDYVKDVYIAVDTDAQQITLTAAVVDGTDPEVALEYADTMVRQFNLFAQIQDSKIRSASKDYYGGLYDYFSALVGVAPLSQIKETKQWYVYDAIAKGANTKLNLTKKI